MIDSKNWCPFTRKRYFFSTLPSGKERGDRKHSVTARMKPWDQEWGTCMAAGNMAPMMGSREVTARGNIV
eukprot:2213053-Heterocapsa_arctica.AAC.1